MESVNVIVALALVFVAWISFKLGAKFGRWQSTKKEPK